MKFYKEDNESPAAIEYAASAPAGFTEVTDAAEIKQCLINVFTQYAVDGLAAYNDLRADVYSDYYNSIITTAQLIAAEKHLAALRTELRSGNWLTAQDTNTNLALSGIYDQTMKDEIQTILDNYVTANY